MRKITTLFLLMICAFLANVVDVSAQQTILLNENFDNITTGVPSGWSNADFTCSSSYRWQSDPDGYGGTRGVRFYVWGSSSGSYSTLKTPVLNLNQAYYLRFKYKNPTSYPLEVRISLDGGSTYSTVIANDLQSVDWAEAEYSLSDYTSQSNVRIVFYGMSDYGSYNMYLDDVVIESAPICKSPDGLQILNLTTKIGRAHV